MKEAEQQGGAPPTEGAPLPEAPPPAPKRALRLVAAVRDFASGQGFLPVLMLVPALAAGLLLAPQLATRTYPTDRALLGTPAVGNIKAPHDIDVADVQTTKRLVDEALARVRR